MKRLRVIFCILWIGFIFYNSSQTATVSGEVSGEIVNYIRNIIKCENNKLEHSDVYYKRLKFSFEDIIKNIIRTIRERHNNWKDKSTISKVDNFIRKLAHGLEFFVLAILVFLALCNKKINSTDLVIRTLFIVLIFAVLDEYLQSYIPGRGSLVSDVLIDFWGGCFGILVFKVFSKLIYKEKKGMKEKELKVG